MEGANKAVIFLTFANDYSNPDRFLKALEPEKAAIQSALIKFQQRGWGIVHPAPSSQPQLLLQDLNKFSNQIIIFHFSGHAGGVQLVLETALGAPNQLHRINLARFLATEKQLKLVFLNGCSTKEQIDTLIEIGVPAIIATDQSIQDSKAALFAATFYESFVAGSTLKQAFLKAKGVVEPADQLESIYRCFVLDEALPLFPWGLYLSDESVENWKLSDYEELNKQRTHQNTPWSFLLYMFGGLLFIVSMVLWVWGSKPMSNFGVEIEAQADRFAFRYLEGPNLSLHTPLKSIGIQNFHSGNIPADHVMINGEPTIFPVKGNVELKQIEELGDSYLYMEDVGIRHFAFSPSAEIVLSIAELSKQKLQIDIDESQYIESHLIAQDTLPIQTIPSPVIINGIEGLPERQLGGIDWTLFGVGQEFSISGNEGLNSFYLEFDEPLNIKETGLVINNISFQKRDGQQAVSSIQGGTIYFKEHDPPYKSISLKAHDELLTKPTNPFGDQFASSH